MSIKYICDICKEEIIELKNCPDISIVTIEGRKFEMRNTSKKVVPDRRVFYIHTKKCLQKLLDLFKKK